LNCPRKEANIASSSSISSASDDPFPDSFDCSVVWVSVFSCAYVSVFSTFWYHYSNSFSETGAESSCCCFDSSVKSSTKCEQSSMVLYNP